MEVNVKPSFATGAPPITDWLREEMRRFISGKVGCDVQVHITMPAESVETATTGSSETLAADEHSRCRGEGM